MITRIVKLTIAEYQVDEFQKLFSKFKSQIASFPGCTGVDLLQDVNDPQVFMTYSQWESEDAFNAYRKSVLFGEVWPATKRLFAAKAEAWSLVKKIS